MSTEEAADEGAVAFAKHLEKLDADLAQAEHDHAAATKSWDTARGDVSAVESEVGALPMNATAEDRDAATLRLVTARNAVETAKLRTAHCDNRVSALKAARKRVLFEERKRLCLKRHDELTQERIRLAKLAEQYLKSLTGAVMLLFLNGRELDENVSTVVPEFDPKLLALGLHDGGRGIRRFSLTGEYLDKEWLHHGLVDPFYKSFVYGPVGAEGKVLTSARDGVLTRSAEICMAEVRALISKHLDEGTARPMVETNVVPIRSGGGIEQAFVSQGGEAA